MRRQEPSFTIPWRYEDYQLIRVFLTAEVAGRRDDHLIEIQLRTAALHDWADFVESLGERTGHQLKDGQGPEELLKYLRVGA